MKKMRRPKCGMTVVEVIVAMMLVSIGLLGVAGSTTLALHTTLDSHQRRIAIRRTESRAALEQARGCSSSRNGSTSDPLSRITEVWSVGPAANGFAPLRDSVAWISARGTDAYATSTAIQC